MATDTNATTVATLQINDLVFQGSCHFSPLERAGGGGGGRGEEPPTPDPRCQSWLDTFLRSSEAQWSSSLLFLMMTE